MDEKIIKQIKSNEELRNIGDDIIDLLKYCNPVEQYKVINSLHTSLLELIKKDGIIIIEEKI